LLQVPVEGVFASEVPTSLEALGRGVGVLRPSCRLRRVSNKGLESIWDDDRGQEAVGWTEDSS